MRKKKYTHSYIEIVGMKCKYAMTYYKMTSGRFTVSALYIVNSCVSK